MALVRVSSTITQRKVREEKLRKGLCSVKNCNNPLVEGKRMCKEHREYHREKGMEYRKRMRYSQNKSP